MINPRGRMDWTVNVGVGAINHGLCNATSANSVTRLVMELLSYMSDPRSQTVRGIV